VSSDEVPEELGQHLIVEASFMMMNQVVLMMTKSPKE